MASSARDGGAPVVSVLLPAFQAAATLRAALHSVQRQSLAAWECVVVDDGSRDGTAAIAAEFAARDARFVVLREPHRGLVAALTAGLAHCRGAFVARMDADDVMHRSRLALQHAALAAAPELCGVGCHVRMFPRVALTDGRRAYETWLNGLATAADIDREAFVECPLAHPTWFLRAAALRRFAYVETDGPEDYDVLLRILGAGLRMGVVPRRLHGWREGPLRLSRLSARYTIDAFTRCKAEHLARGFLRGTDRYVLWGYGGTGKALRRALAARGKDPAYILELHPRRIGERIHGAPVVPPGALAELERLPVVASVAGAAARAEIRAFLASIRYRELVDFVCAA